MRRILLTFIALTALATAANAQTVTCSLTGLTPQQQTIVDQFIASLNARGVEGSPFADFNAYCGYQSRASVLAYIALLRSERLQRIGLALIARGEETATPAQCTAAGVAAGCRKSEVVCFVLTGSAVCN